MKYIDIIHSICIELVTEREQNDDNLILVGFSAEEHFQEDIGQITIPKELLGKTNLRSIYETGSRMKGFIEMSA